MVRSRSSTRVRLRHSPGAGAARTGRMARWRHDRTADAPGHRVPVLPRVLRRTGHPSRAGRDAGQRGPRLPGHDRHGWSAATGPTHLVACLDNDWRPAFRVEAIPSYKTHRLPRAGHAGRRCPRARPRRCRYPATCSRRSGWPGGRHRLRGGRRDRHPDAPGARLPGRDRDRGPRPVPAGRRRGTGAGPLHRPRAGWRPYRPGRPGVPCPEQYDMPPAPPYADLATLRGDASDGLPGVAGVGEKTAATLINRYGDLATLRRALADGDPLLKGARRAPPSRPPRTTWTSRRWWSAWPPTRPWRSTTRPARRGSPDPGAVVRPGVAVRPDLADQPGARRARAGRLTGAARPPACPVSLGAAGGRRRRRASPRRPPGRWPQSRLRFSGATPFGTTM